MVHNVTMLDLLIITIYIALKKNFHSNGKKGRRVISILICTSYVTLFLTGLSFDQIRDWLSRGENPQWG